MVKQVHPYRLAMASLLMLVASHPGWSQAVDFQCNAGLGEANHRWENSNKHPHEYRCELTLLVSAQIGATVAVRPGQKIRFLLSGTTGNLSNQQFSADYQWSITRKAQRELYVFLGPSLNVLSGTYTYNDGYVAPDGPGDYRHVDQRWRPGMKFGIGFQWSKHWAVELDAHIISMATSGYQSVPQSTTGYAAAIVSFRFPAK